LRQPLRRWMPGHREPQQLPPSVAYNNKCKQALEAKCRNHAQINRSNRLRMIAQECPPALGWRTPASDHVLGHRRLGGGRGQLLSCPNRASHFPPPVNRELAGWTYWHGSAGQPIPQQKLSGTRLSIVTACAAGAARSACLYRGNFSMAKQRQLRSRPRFET
jgi:hypothetical protein